MNKELFNDICDFLDKNNYKVVKKIDDDDLEKKKK